MAPAPSASGSADDLGEKNGARSSSRNVQPDADAYADVNDLDDEKRAARLGVTQASSSSDDDDELAEQRSISSSRSSSSSSSSRSVQDRTDGEVEVLAAGSATEDGGEGGRRSLSRSRSRNHSRGTNRSRSRSRGSSHLASAAGSVLGRVLSRTSIRTDPGPPPDGGMQAWIAAACTHLVIMDTWGVINSFGSFQAYYTTLLGRSPSDVAWIGSFQIFLLFFIGTFTGRLTDAGYFRHLMAAGTVLQTVGIFATAQATQYWHFFLSQGVLVGLGNGCIFCPALATLSTYFSRRRSLAIGIAATGSATGGLVFPSIVRQLLPSVGFAWTMRVIGFVQLSTLIVANIGLRTRLPPRRSGRIVEWAAFREPTYSLYAAGSFFCFWAVYIVFFYVASFSRNIIGLSYTDSLNLLLVLNGVGAIGRLLPNYVADRVGAVNMFFCFGLYAGVTALAWLGVHSTTGLYVWTVFYGIAAGGIQSLFPAGLTSLNARDLSKAGVRMGMVFTINSIATLTGPPVAGALISSDGGRYRGAQIFTGVVLLLGTSLLGFAKMALGRERGEGWRSRV